jgi:hypothetical protein
LLALARRGRVAVVEGGQDAADAVVVLERRGPIRLPTTRHPLAALAAACSAGWLVATGAADEWTLAASGRERARRLRLERVMSQAQPLSAPPACAPPEPGQRETRPLRNEAESPLAWLRRRLDKDGRPLVGDAQFEAGERLRADLWLAGMTPRVTSSWSGLPTDRRGGGSAGIGLEMADRLVAARQRVTAALDAVGTELAGILIDVCGHLRGLEEIERCEGWPQRSAKLVLTKALTALARHYGLLPAETGRELIARRLRHWGAPDYRPTIIPGRPPDGAA